AALLWILVEDLDRSVIAGGVVDGGDDVRDTAAEVSDGNRGRREAGAEFHRREELPGMRRIGEQNDGVATRAHVGEHQVVGASARASGTGALWWAPRAPPHAGGV